MSAKGANSRFIKKKEVKDLHGMEGKPEPLKEPVKRKPMFSNKASNGTKERRKSPGFTKGNAKSPSTGKKAALGFSKSREHGKGAAKKGSESSRRFEPTLGNPGGNLAEQSKSSVSVGNANFIKSSVVLPTKIATMSFEDITVPSDVQFNKVIIESINDNASDLIPSITRLAADTVLSMEESKLDFVSEEPVFSTEVEKEDTGFTML